MKRAAVLVAMTALSACTTPTSRFPSLLPREIEKRRDEPEPVRADPVAATDPALDAQIAEMSASLAKSASAFPAAADRATAATDAAVGSELGSEPWLTAQAALADLAALRSADVTLLEKVESIAIARGTNGLPPYPALVTLRDRVEAQTNAAVAVGEKLQAKLAQN